MLPPLLHSLLRPLLLVALATLPPAWADTAYPSKPVRFIAPVGPGSGGDSITRFVAERAATLLGQPTFVENRPGSDQTIAAQTLLAAPADGYSVLLVSPGSMVINPIVIKELSYDVRDILPLVGAARANVALVASPNGKFANITELLAAARRAPGAVSLANYGTTYRLGGLALQQQAQVRFNEVPYKGASQMLTDVIGGTLDAALTDLGGALPLIRSGKLRALAVASLQRLAELPEVPTLRESGLPDFELTVWVGFAISAKTPAPIAQKLESVLAQVVAQPEFAAMATRSANMEVMGQNGREFSAQIARDTQRYRALAQGLDLAR
nr:tripartite tricarboxylate transporter substrate binding protein [Variovorax boronicumulans]